MGITWTLYLMRYVSKGSFVLSHFAWLTGLQTALMGGASLVNSYLLAELGAGTTSLWLLGIVPLFLVAGNKMALNGGVVRARSLPRPKRARLR